VGSNLADSKDKVQEAVGKAQNSEDASAFSHVKMIPRMEEPKPGASKNRLLAH
jgi:hypothetical protein